MIVFGYLLNEKSDDESEELIEPIGYNKLSITMYDKVILTSYLKLIGNK